MAHRVLQKIWTFSDDALILIDSETEKIDLEWIFEDISMNEEYTIQFNDV